MLKKISIKSIAFVLLTTMAFSATAEEQDCTVYSIDIANKMVEYTGHAYDTCRSEDTENPGETKFYLTYRGAHWSMLCNPLECTAPVASQQNG